MTNSKYTAYDYTFVNVGFTASVLVSCIHVRGHTKIIHHNFITLFSSTASVLLYQSIQWVHVADKERCQ